MVYYMANQFIHLLVIFVLQFESQYLKNRKRYRCEIGTRVGYNDPTCSDLSKRVVNM